MPETLNYKHLHYFWAVAHEGSIAKASQKLHITPQTISGQLSLLEQRIGNELFEKVGRGLKLTETGVLVLRYADEIFALGRELNDVLRGAPAVSSEGRVLLLIVQVQLCQPQRQLQSGHCPAVFPLDQGGLNALCTRCKAKTVRGAGAFLLALPGAEYKSQSPSLRRGNL